MALIRALSGSSGGGGAGGGLLIEITNPSIFNNISDSSPKTINTDDFSAYTNVVVYGKYGGVYSYNDRFGSVITDFVRGTKYTVKVSDRSGDTISRNVTFDASNNKIIFGNGYYNGSVRNDLGWIERIVFFNDSQSITIS